MLPGDKAHPRGAVLASCRPGLLAAALLACSQAVPAQAQQQPSTAPSRGQLLYEAHCIQCHTTQMHWREARVARDWASLRIQVQRWQSRIGEQWPDEDVNAVANHLNATIYHYPVPNEQADRMSRDLVASSVRVVHR